jgi:chromosome segregation ATPase
VSPQGDISSIQEELESAKETLKINTLELSVAKLKVEELTSEIRCIEAEHKERVRALTSDLIKAREYIEILLSDNKTLRVRMSEALSRVQSLQTESLSMKDRLIDESNKREIAESRVRDVEEQLLSLDENISSSAHSKSHNLLGRLCGSGNWSSSSKQRIAGYDHARSSVVRNPQVRSASVTPGTNSPDPYKELMQLLAASSSVPPGNPAAATSSRI